MSGAQGLSAKAAVSGQTAYRPWPEAESHKTLPVQAGAKWPVLSATQIVARGLQSAPRLVLRISLFAPLLLSRTLLAYPLAIARWWLKADATPASRSLHTVSQSPARAITRRAGGAVVTVGALTIPVVLVIAAVPMLSTARNTSEAQNHGNAGLQLYLSGQLQDAIKEFDRAIQLNPRLASAYVARAVAYADIGETDHALFDASTAIQLDPDSASAYVNRARAYLQLGKNTGALIDATKAIDLDPNLSVAYVQRANARKGLGDYQGALEDTNRAIELDPAFVPSHITRGLVYSAMGESQHAVDEWVAALSLTQDPDTTAQIDALINKAGGAH